MKKLIAIIACFAILLAGVWVYASRSYNLDCILFLGPGECNCLYGFDEDWWTLERVMTDEANNNKLIDFVVLSSEIEESADHIDLVIYTVQLSNDEIIQLFSFDDAQIFFPQIGERFIMVNFGVRDLHGYLFAADLTAKVQDDDTIQAIDYGENLFLPYNGYTVEQIMEFIAGWR